jgi:hypothetical protein
MKNAKELMLEYSAFSFQRSEEGGGDVCRRWRL